MNETPFLHRRAALSLTQEDVAIWDVVNARFGYAYLLEQLSAFRDHADSSLMLKSQDYRRRKGYDFTLAFTEMLGRGGASMVLCGGALEPFEFPKLHEIWE